MSRGGRRRNRRSGGSQPKATKPTRLYFRVQLYSIVCDSDWSVPHVHTVCVHLHMPVIIKYRSLQYSCSSLRCRGSAHYSKFGVSRSAHVRSGQHPALRGVAATGGNHSAGGSTLVTAWSSALIRQPCAGSAASHLLLCSILQTDK